MGRHAFHLAYTLICVCLVAAAPKSVRNPLSKGGNTAGSSLISQLRFRSQEKDGTESKVSGMMRFKPTSKIASMKFAMEGKTPGEPIATQIPKTQKRKRFSLASSGGGGRALMQFLGTLRGYGGLQKLASHTNMIATNSGSSWLMNRYMLEGANGDMSRASGKATPLYEELVEQLAGKFDSESYENGSKKARKDRAEIIAYVEDALKMVVLTPKLSMFLGYFTSTMSGDVGPEWYDFCQARAVCQRKSMREQHECYPNELKPEERIQTIWSQQVVLSSSGTFFQDKKTKKLYQYDLSCNMDGTEEAEMPLMIPMYLNIDTRNSDMRMNDHITVDIPYLKFKRCRVTIKRLTKTNVGTVESIFQRANQDLKNEYMGQCKLKQYAPRPTPIKEFEMSGADIIESLRLHYVNLWRDHPGRFSAASSAAAAIAASPKAIESLVIKFLQRKVSDKLQLPEKDISFEYLMIIKKIGVAVVNAFGSMARKTFSLNGVFLNVPDPQIGYSAKVDVSEYGVPKQLNFAFLLMDGGYIDNHAITDVIHNLQRSGVESDIILIDHSSDPNVGSGNSVKVSINQKFENSFFKPVNDNVVQIGGGATMRGCDKNINSPYSGCAFSNQIISGSYENITYEGDDAELFKNKFYSYKVTTIDNEYYGIKAGSTYNIHLFVPCPEDVHGVGMLPRSVDVIEKVRQKGAWMNGKTKSGVYTKYDEFMYIAHRAEKENLLSKFVESMGDEMRFKSQKLTFYSPARPGMNNKLLKKGSALEKEAQMRFRETSNSLMCNVVWSMGLKLLKKFMGVNAGNVMAKFKESELANKHNLGDICEKSESTHDSEYLRNLWKSIYAELIRNFPEDANLPIPAGLPIPKDRVIAIMKNCADFLGNKIVHLDLDSFKSK